MSQLNHEFADYGGDAKCMPGLGVRGSRSQDDRQREEPSGDAAKSRTSQQHG